LSTRRLFLMISALLLINKEPNLESGANIDCCKLYRDNRGVRSALLLVTSHLLTQVEGIWAACQGIDQSTVGLMMMYAVPFPKPPVYSIAMKTLLWWVRDYSQCVRKYFLRVDMHFNRLGHVPRHL
jgi:hypothetical protein